MSKSQRYRDQHNEILDIAKQIGALLNPADLTAKHAEVSKLLNALAGKIKIHLSVEDQNLYPSLVKHSDSKVRELATSFSKEMIPITEAFTKYYAKWSVGSAVTKDPNGFITETKGIFTALDKRIQKENTVLYVEFDKAG